MANYAALKKEITTDPLSIGYSSMTNQQIVDSLNTPNRTIIQSKLVTARTMMNNIGPSQAAAILDSLNTASSSNSIIKWTMSFLTSNEGIDAGSPATRSTIDQLVAASVLTQTQGDSLKQLAHTIVSRGVEIGFGDVSLSDVLVAQNPGLQVECSYPSGDAYLSVGSGQGADILATLASPAPADLRIDVYLSVGFGVGTASETFVERPQAIGFINIAAGQTQGYAAFNASVIRGQNKFFLKPQFSAGLTGAATVNSRA